jgi:uncharacterized protein
MDNVFHEGELAVQAKAGVEAQAQNVGRIIAPQLPQGADRYLAELPILFQGGTDAQGNVWASVLSGEPGFVRVIDPNRVQINAEPLPGDPLALADRETSPAGFLAINLMTRQRFRFNGEVTQNPDGLRVHIQEAYGNCPKYIQQRQATTLGSTTQPKPATTGNTLTDEQRRLIEQADTFFIASIAECRGRGADVSHRGGAPGFVRVTPDGKITFKDYPGNNMFQTLGNLNVDPRAGLMFIDFETGSTLQLSGRAAVVWSPDPEDHPQETGRAVSFEPTRIVERDHALALRWSLRGYSPYNPS